MRPLYLRVTYVGGRSEVAYLRLPRERGEKSVESERVEPEPFWAPLGREALEALISTAQQRHLDPAQLLFAQGENASAIAVVLSGELEISRVDENGHRMRLRALGPGGSVGLSTPRGETAHRQR